MSKFVLSAALVLASLVGVSGAGQGGEPSQATQAEATQSAQAAPSAAKEPMYRLMAKNPSNPGRGWVLYAYYNSENLQVARVKAAALRKAGWNARILNQFGQVVV